MQAIFKIASSQELPPIPPHLSDEANDFIRSCLQRNPENRPCADELLKRPFVSSASSTDVPALRYPSPGASPRSTNISTPSPTSPQPPPKRVASMPIMENMAEAGGNMVMDWEEEEEPFQAAPPAGSPGKGCAAGEPIRSSLQRSQSVDAQAGQGTLEQQAQEQAQQQAQQQATLQAQQQAALQAQQQHAVQRQQHQQQLPLLTSQPLPPPSTPQSPLLPQSQQELQPQQRPQPQQVANQRPAAVRPLPASVAASSRSSGRRSLSEALSSSSAGDAADAAARIASLSGASVGSSAQGLSAADRDGLLNPAAASAAAGSALLARGARPPVAAPHASPRRLTSPEMQGPIHLHPMPTSPTAQKSCISISVHIQQLQQDGESLASAQALTSAGGGAGGGAAWAGGTPQAGGGSGGGGGGGSGSPNSRGGQQQQPYSAFGVGLPFGNPPRSPGPAELSPSAAAAAAAAAVADADMWAEELGGSRSGRAVRSAGGGAGIARVGSASLNAGTASMSSAVAGTERAGAHSSSPGLH